MAKERAVGSLKADGSDGATRFECSDVPPLLPFWLACLLGAFVGVVLIGITLGFPLADAQQFRGPLQQLPPAPRLQLAPAKDLLAYRTAEQKELEGRRRNGLSIEAAMAQTARQGWGTPK